MTRRYRDPTQLSVRVQRDALAAWRYCSDVDNVTLGAWINKALLLAPHDPPASADVGGLMSSVRHSTAPFAFTVDASSLKAAKATGERWAGIHEARRDGLAHHGQTDAELVRMLCNARCEAEAMERNPTWSEARFAPVHYARYAVVPVALMRLVQRTPILANETDGWLKITARALETGPLVPSEARRELAEALACANATGGERRRIVVSTAAPLFWLARTIAPRLPIADLVTGAACVVCLTHEKNRMKRDATR